MLFDKKFGSDFLSTVPSSPGVYRFYQDEALQYVGKATSLRKRLGQYKNAGRKKRDRKHREIVKSSNRIVFEVCPSEQEARLLENEIIRSEKPPLNIVGAFSFLYPCLGIKQIEDHTLCLAYTTEPGEFTEYDLYGAFRSRASAKLGFEGLVQLLKFVGHAEKSLQKIQYSRIVTFRRVPMRVSSAIPEFLLGESESLIDLLIEELLERTSARKESAVVQDALDALDYFRRQEIQPLRDVRMALSIENEFVLQEKRDALFILASGQE